MTNAIPRRPQYSVSLSVPSTQNTAPIIEFRCLYTHDLRRKAKRWQDGILRFHTFNKRVMVYDVLRNFIGDSHWREEADVRDGDELRLERGVLVEVSEEVERVGQNRDELLKKVQARKDNRSQDQDAGNTHTPMVSATTGAQAIMLSPAQQSSTSSHLSVAKLQPRSLNSLLGISRGQRGRAALPDVSPHDQQRECISAAKRSEVIFSLPKRRKTSSEQHIPSGLTSSPTSEVIIPRQPTISPILSPSPPQVSQALKRRTKKSSTTEEESFSLPTLSRQVIRPPPSRIIEIDSDDGVVSFNPIEEKGLGQQKTSSKTRKALKKNEKQPLTRPLSPVTTAKVSTSRSRPPNAIRMAPKTTRRKLLCAAALDSKTTDSNASHNVGLSEKSKDTDVRQDVTRGPARPTFDAFELSGSGSDDDFFISLRSGLVEAELQKQDNMQASPSFSHRSYEAPNIRPSSIATTGKPPNNADGKTDGEAAKGQHAKPSISDGSQKCNHLQGRQCLFLPPDSPPGPPREATRTVPDTHLTNQVGVDSNHFEKGYNQQPLDYRQETQSHQSLQPIIHLFESPEPEMATEQHLVPSENDSSAEIDFAAHVESLQAGRQTPAEVQQNTPPGRVSDDLRVAEKHQSITTANDTTLSIFPLLSKPFKRPTVKKNLDIAKATAGTVGLKPLGAGGEIVQGKPNTVTEGQSCRAGITSVGKIVDRDSETGPWSREAYDLFSWRPPPRREYV